MSTANNTKLLDEVRAIMRLKHYSIHTERTYCDWIKQYVKFHRMPHDRSELMTRPESKVE